MDKQQIDQLHKDIRTAVESMCEERGFKIRLAGGTIGQVESILKFKITPDADANPEAAKDLADAKKSQFGLYKFKFGYDADWFGKVFIAADGKAYRIVGVKPTAEKNCLEIERLSDKKVYVCPVSYVKNGIQQPQAA